MQQGYYQFPTVYKNKIVFVSEDDLWSVSTKGGKATRLTANLNIISYPHFSPDGKWIAFIGKDEGSEEIYMIPAEGGIPKRMTFIAGFKSNICSWSNDGNHIYFSSSYQEPFKKNQTLYQINKNGGLPEKLHLGHGKNISYGTKNRCVIGRNTQGIERWKRYRGGTSGVLWIDNKGKGEFKEWEGIKGNYASPMWIGERIYFISDHEGIANIYSINNNGKDIQQHTEHKDFFCKQATADGKTIVYAAGSDIYQLNITSNKNKKIDIIYHSPRVQCQRKFVDASKYLQGYDIHPKGHSLVINTRGKSFETANWEKIVHNIPAKDGVRQRLVRYMSDGKSFLLVTDENGSEQIEIHHKKNKKITRLKKLNYGRARDIKISPNNKYAAIANHKAQLILINLEKFTSKIIDTSAEIFIEGFNWSKDSQWICYGNRCENHRGNISVYSIKNKVSTIITENDFNDHRPAFSLCGNYIYFLSNRIFNPVYDSVYFDLNFPRSTKPFCIILNKNAENPFLAKPLTPGEEEPDESKEQKINTVEIDFENITERIVEMPVKEGIYEDLTVTSKYIITLSQPIQGSLTRNIYSDNVAPIGELKMWDLLMSEEKKIARGVGDFKISSSSETLVYSAGKKLRVLALNPEIKLSCETTPSRKTGWIDLSHIRVPVMPNKEWIQIFDEMWRMQQENYWTEDMSGIDWDKIYQRYRPLVNRIGSRGELSTLAWEMQGELGTSHAYEIGGDYKAAPNYSIGFLGCDFTYDTKTKGYKITHIVNGDNWHPEYASPLKRPGANIEIGDTIIAINHISLDESLSPYEALVNQAGNEVTLTIKSGKKEKIVRVKTLHDEQKLRYREWIEKNRKYVHEKTNGKVGYVHLPNMAPEGYSEFHRYYEMEAHRGSLIIDVRFNGGGHVSQLILEKLNRKVLGLREARWRKKTTYHYPDHSVYGHMVTLTNEYAGSDGDIFSHSFKMLGLGKLIGRRTWGGVVGIWPRHFLIDGSLTTQPEFASWFNDVGYGVENYGTDPDIFVDIAPQDYKAGIEPQLDRAIEEINAEIKDKPVVYPDFGKRPDLSLPS
ncbi:MAG: tricorn protease [Maribacter sp.]|jgi:tricorn protease